MSLRKMEENLGSGRSSVMSVLVGIIVLLIMITFIIITKNRLHNAVYKITKDVCHYV